LNIKYKDVSFRSRSLEQIACINRIFEEYSIQGYSLTLRQVFYQLVARGVIENSEKSYKNIGNLINNGRLAGLVSWTAVEDRTRNIRALSHWSSPQEIITDISDYYCRNLWENQSRYVEVWIEKDALIGIVEPTAQQYDVPCFSCRGYVSQSEMWAAAQRFIQKHEEGKECKIIHLGDHDPSGIDMTRDITDRLKAFGAKVRIDRIALNRDQIDAYNPPPNPTKITDTRASGYIRLHGSSSWELDALEPRILASLIAGKIKDNLDQLLFDAAIERQETERAQIKAMSKAV
jgi:hypothetical protein